MAELAVAEPLFMARYGPLTRSNQSAGGVQTGLNSDQLDAGFFHLMPRLSPFQLFLLSHHFIQLHARLSYVSVLTYPVQTIVYCLLSAVRTSHGHRAHDNKSVDSQET